MRERRRAVRLEVKWSGEATLRDGDTIPVNVVDVSIGGVQLTTEADIRPSELCEVQFDSGANREPFRFRVKHRWSETDKSVTYVGLQFVRPSREELEALGTMIESLYRVQQRARG